jgi:hypothetical protein
MVLDVTTSDVVSHIFLPFQIINLPHHHAFFCDVRTNDWWSHTYIKAQLKAMKQIVFFRFGNNGDKYSISIITWMLSLQ